MRYSGQLSHYFRMDGFATDPFSWGSQSMAPTLCLPCFKSQDTPCTTYIRFIPRGVYGLCLWLLFAYYLMLYRISKYRVYSLWFDRTGPQTHDLSRFEEKYIHMTFFEDPRDS